MLITLGGSLERAERFSSLIQLWKRKIRFFSLFQIFFFFLKWNTCNTEKCHHFKIVINSKQKFNQFYKCQLSIIIKSWYTCNKDKQSKRLTFMFLLLHLLLRRSSRGFYLFLKRLYVVIIHFTIFEKSLVKMLNLTWT